MVRRPSLFDAQDIDEAYARGKQDLDVYLQDWLAFYDSEAIEARQRRWDEEADDARWAAGVEQGRPGSKSSATAS
jgi:hypothetical protein